MTDVEVHEALIRWLIQETGLTVIKAHQSGRRPTPPYLVVNFIRCREFRDNPRLIQYEDTTNQNSEGNAEVLARPVIDAEWDFSVHAYGPAPTDQLRPIKSRAPLVQRLEPMFPALVIHDTGAINNVPDPVNNRWEARAQMNILVRGVIRDGAVIDAVEDVSVDVSTV